MTKTESRHWQIWEKNQFGKTLSSIVLKKNLKFSHQLCYVHFYVTLFSMKLLAFSYNYRNRKHFSLCLIIAYYTILNVKSLKRTKIGSLNFIFFFTSRIWRLEWVEKWNWWRIYSKSNMRKKWWEIESGS